MESDEEIRRVPEFGAAEQAGPSTSEKETAAAAGTSSTQQQAATARRSGRSPADKEHRRLKRCMLFLAFFLLLRSSFRIHALILLLLLRDIFVYVQYMTIEHCLYALDTFSFPFFIHENSQRKLYSIRF
jgi:hypothetical protein